MTNHVDYIIVGLGIAGISLCERLQVLNKSFVVIDHAGQNNSTKVAGGVVNPTVLKRFTLAWKALEFFEEAEVFYNNLSKKIEEDIVFNTSIKRIFSNIEEQNQWAIAFDNFALRPFLSERIIPNTNPMINAPNGFGEVKRCFRVDTFTLLKAYTRYLTNIGAYFSEDFCYESLSFHGLSVQYKDISAKKIIFSQGALLKQNPFCKLSKNAFIPKKGEYIIVKAPELRSHSILKGALFVIPLGGDLYKVGATFDHHDHKGRITKKGMQELLQKLERIINCSFEVVGQVAGVRPTVKDRRPLLGTINDTRVVFFNGLGTRGLLMAPLLSKLVLDHVVYDKVIPSAINIKRFVAQ